MKNIFGALILIFSGCTIDNLDGIEANVREDFTIGAGEKINLHATETNLIVETVAISESRCPSDVVCITAGSYGADLKISDNQDSVMISLCNGDCGGKFTAIDTVSFTLQSHNYKIILKNLLPYPSTSNQDEKKMLVLEILD